MNITYNVPFPSAAQKRMSPALDAFYKFIDSNNETMELSFDTEMEATKAANSISGAKWRRELPVEIKRIGKRVYVKKVGKAVTECTDR